MCSSDLPQRGVNGFEKVFGTPHNLDIAKIAASYGISSTDIKTSSDLRHEISHHTNGIRIVVAKMPNRESNADFISRMLVKYSENI